MRGGDRTQHAPNTHDPTLLPAELDSHPAQALSCAVTAVLALVYLSVRIDTLQGVHALPGQLASGGVLAWSMPCLAIIGASWYGFAEWRSRVESHVGWRSEGILLGIGAEHAIALVLAVASEHGLVVLGVFLISLTTLTGHSPVQVGCAPHWA